MRASEPRFDASSRIPRDVRPILLVSLVLRLLVFFSASAFTERYFTLDARGYMDVARNLHAAYLEPASAFWAIGLMRTPVYPTFASASLLASGGSPAAVVLAQILLGMIAILLTYRLGAMLGGPKVARVAALILAIDPATIIYTNLLQPESLFTVLLLGGVIAWLNACRGRETAGALTAGLLLGLAALCRPIGVFLPIPCVIVAAMSRPRRAAFLSTLGLLASFVALTGGWIARNAYYTGAPVLSTIEGVNLLNYRAAGALAIEEGRTIEQERAVLAARLASSNADLSNPARLSQSQSRLAREVLIAHPYGALVSALQGAERLFLGTGLTALSGLLGDPAPEQVEGFFENSLQIVFIAILVLAYAGATLGCIRLSREGRLRIAIIPLVFVTYFVVMSAGPEATTRFRLPIMPFVVILAGIGFAGRSDELGDESPPL